MHNLSVKASVAVLKHGNIKNVGRVGKIVSITAGNRHRGTTVQVRLAPSYGKTAPLFLNPADVVLR